MVEAWRAPLMIQISAGLHGAALGLAALHPAWWPQALAAVAGNHLVLGAAVLSPGSQALGPTLCRLPGAPAAVALTFDDGPDPAVTPRVLDLLAAAAVTATFFCIGDRARRHPALVRRCVAAGHAIGNHTMTHPGRFACLGPGALRREVRDAQAVLSDVAGQPPRWFRAPMGFRNPLLNPVLHQVGLQQAAWTRRGFDTRRTDPAVVLRRLMRGLAGGDVLLLHDGHAARCIDGEPVVLRVLPPLLAALAERGLTVAPLPGASAGAAGAAGSRIPNGYASM